ncbi:MAG: metallophosphoesterase [Gaiellales bacterium]
MPVRNRLVLAGALLIAGLAGVTVAVVLATGDEPPPASPSESATLLAAGDIAECESDGDEQTAELLAARPDATIATLGDNAYDHGTLEEFERCFDPSWGRFRDRMRPSTGNHDHRTTDAAGYAAYFGEAGGPFDRYYYAYELGSWQVVVLNSDCWRIGGCEEDDPQARWLADELERSSARCTVAYWHRPPFSSGRYGDAEATERVRPLWRILHRAGVEVLLTGHEHSYERFAPMDGEGRSDDDRGVRLFVVGTGGSNLREFKNPPLETTEARSGDTWGVLELTLRAGAYDWEFLPVGDGDFRDAGSGTCH